LPATVAENKLNELQQPCSQHRCLPPLLLLRCLPALLLPTMNARLYGCSTSAPNSTEVPAPAAAAVTTVHLRRQAVRLLNVCTKLLRFLLLLLLLLWPLLTFSARNVASDGRTSQSHSTCCVSGSPKNSLP
jgi:hypothetical protein